MSTFLNDKEVHPINISCVYQAYRITETERGKLEIIQVGRPHTTSWGAYRELENTNCDEQEYHVRTIYINRDTELEAIAGLHYS